MPEIELPKVARRQCQALGPVWEKRRPWSSFGRAIVRWPLDELADLGPDVVQKLGSRGVAVVGIAVKEPAANVRSAVERAEAGFVQLVDADGKAFAKVGAEKLPWTLVLNANGKIVWFDLEYSLATRRELQQTLLATVR